MCGGVMRGFHLKNMSLYAQDQKHRLIRAESSNIVPSLTDGPHVTSNHLL